MLDYGARYAKPTVVIDYHDFTRMENEEQKRIEYEIGLFEHRMMMNLLVSPNMCDWFFRPPYYIKFTDMKKKVKTKTGALPSSAGFPGTNMIVKS